MNMTRNQAGYYRLNSSDIKLINKYLSKGANKQLINQFDEDDPYKYGFAKWYFRKIEKNLFELVDNRNNKITRIDLN